MVGIRTCDRESQVQRPNHYTTEPPHQMQVERTTRAIVAYMTLCGAVQRTTWTWNTEDLVSDSGYKGIRSSNPPRTWHYRRNNHFSSVVCLFPMVITQSPNHILSSSFISVHFFLILYFPQFVSPFTHILSSSFPFVPLGFLLIFNKHH